MAVAVVLAVLTVRQAGGDGPAPAAAPPASDFALPTPSSSSSSPAADTSPSSSPTPVYRPGRAPTGVLAGGIDVRARVVPIAAEGKVLTPPGDVSEVGWWSEGARAGSSRGSVLLTGHTVHTGGGVFDDLGDLSPGESVRVSTSGKPVAYTVTRVRYLTKAELAKAAPRLFDPRGPAQLVLVTCESWDGAGYDGNTVVVATPV